MQERIEYTVTVKYKQDYIDRIKKNTGYIISTDNFVFLSREECGKFLKGEPCYDDMDETVIPNFNIYEVESISTKSKPFQAIERDFFNAIVKDGVIAFCEKEGIPYTKAEAVFNRIMNDYQNNSEELNSLFFDIHVKMKEKDLITLYERIQNKINGDTIIRLENVSIEESDNGDNIVWGKRVALIPEEKTFMMQL